MSEYQYYEFQAVDRRLTKAEQEMLRDLSTRARITPSNFTNHYEWGDFKGDPKQLMESCFDLHLYLANWGARRFMIRVPERSLDRHGLEVFLNEVDWVKIWTCGDDLVVDIWPDEIEPDYEEWDDGSGWLTALAPLRADLLSGDLRLFYLLWLTAVDEDLLPDDTAEPLPGIGPLTDALEAAVEFFNVDRDLTAAAATSPYLEEPSPDESRVFVTGLADTEKSDLLLRLIEGDTHIASELRRRARMQNGDGACVRRTVGKLQARAREIREARNRAELERQRDEERRMAEKEEKARRARLDAVGRRGKSVWKEIETEIARRNPSGYERAATLLTDLKQLASEQGTVADFARRLAAIRERHARKGEFIKRLLGL